MDAVGVQSLGKGPPETKRALDFWGQMDQKPRSFFQKAWEEKKEDFFLILA